MSRPLLSILCTPPSSFAPSLTSAAVTAQVEPPERDRPLHAQKGSPPPSPGAGAWARRWRGYLPPAPRRPRGLPEEGGWCPWRVPSTVRWCRPRCAPGVDGRRRRPPLRRGAVPAPPRTVHFLFLYHHRHVVRRSEQESTNIGGRAGAPRRMRGIAGPGLLRYVGREGVMILAAIRRKIVV